MSLRPFVASVGLRTAAYFMLSVAALTGGCRQAATPAPTTAPTAAAVVVTVYFLDEAKYSAAVPPFEVGVSRTVPAGADLPTAVLEAYFAGPTAAEQAEGLVAITSGFTGLRELRLEGQVAHLYLEGECQSMGATYTVAQPILRNLLQFPEIRYVKIYDAAGETEDATGATTSIPFCLEP